MEKEINSNAVCELDEASLEQVTGGMKAKQADPIFAVGGGDVAGPDRCRFAVGLDEINKVRDKADPFGK